MFSAFNPSKCTHLVIHQVYYIKTDSKHTELFIVCEKMTNIKSELMVLYLNVFAFILVSAPLSVFGF